MFFMSRRCPVLFHVCLLIKCSLPVLASRLPALVLTILLISETQLDNSNSAVFDDTAVAIQGHNIYRRDRNAYGGGVAVYVQSHIPLLLRDDLMSSVIEALWMQVHLAHLNPFLLGCQASNVKHVKCGVPQGSSLGPLLFSIFTIDLPLTLNKACVCMYADDSIIYASATTANEVSEILNKELQFVLESLACNKLVLNISKMKSIVFDLS